MANAFALNYDCSNNAIIAIWQLTRQMVQAGWTHIASSLGAATSTAADLWATTKASWFAGITSGNWILLEGPSTLRIPFTTAPGAMREGETITQNVTGATGELVSWIWDGVSLGYAVVMPMTGAFDAVNTIVGNTTGQTFTPNGTIATFRRQMVWWLHDAATTSLLQHRFHCYYQCTDGVAEATELFSDAARLAAVTATVCPGGAAAGANSFPGATSGTFCVYGQGGSGNSATNYTAFTQSAGTAGKAQIMVANAIPSGGVSADGSFVLAIGCPTNDSGSFVGCAFQRLEHGDPGDVEIYGWFTDQLAVNSRTVARCDVGSVDIFGDPPNASYSSIDRGIYQPNWLRRGMSGYGGDGGFIFCRCASLACPDSLASASSVKVQNVTPADADHVSTAFVTTYTREPLWLVGVNAAGRCRKGQARWLFLVQGGNGCDTLDNKQFVQLSNNNQPAIVAGPWDGVTVPVNG